MADEEQIILPNGYTRVAYLESSGTQYITTDYYPEAGQKYISMDVQFIPISDTWSGSKRIFNATENGNPNGAYDILYGCSMNFGGSDNQRYETFWWLGGDRSDNNSVYSTKWSSDTVLNRNILTIKGDSCTYGPQTGTLINGGTRASTIPLTIFGSAENPIGCYRMRLYEFKMGTYENNNISVSLHLIPCLDETDKLCMYDIKSGKSYYNNGSGSFVSDVYFEEVEEEIILPERFIKVDYIQSGNHSEGTHYIDTGIKPNQNTGFYVDFEMISESPSNYGQCIFGSRTSSQTKDFQLSRYSGGILRFGTSHQISAPFSLNYRYQASLRNGIFTHVTGANYNLPTTAWQGDYNIYLFSLNQSNSCVQGGGSKIYRFKLYDGNTLIRDFVPAYDTYNWSFCMYDLVNNKAHYTQGTGKFVSDYEPQNPTIEHLGILHKLPEGFTKVNYLIANGSQYIDTNYVPTNETGYYLEGQGYTTSETYYFGTRNETTTDTRIYFCATNNVNWGWGTYGNLITDAAYQRQENKISHNFLNSRIAKTRVNEKDFVYNLSTLSFTPNKNIFLFGLNNGGTLISGLKGRIDTFLISEGDQIVRQFVPCLDADGIPCMYELYTGTAHYNQGGGQFSYPREYTNDPINLPANYTKCVYLQSNGTQWIDTQFIANEDTGLYLKVQQLNNGNYPPFGSGSSGIYYPPRFNTSNKGAYYAYGASGQLMFYYDKADDLIFTSTLNLYNDKTVNLISEDTKWYGIISNSAQAATYSLWLFSYNTNGSTIDATYGKFSGRIFRAKITQGDYLVHDFVPCLDTDNKPCMYDLVTQTPFYNQSGGEDFAYCVEHQLPSNFVKLDYLESTGTQIIKTGIIPTDSTGIYVDAYHTKYNGNTNGAVIGLRNTNGNTYFTVGRVQRDTNGAGFGWGAYTTPGGNGNVRYEASLNFLNDRKSIITAPAFAQRINTLGTLSFTPTKDLYMFGMNNYDGAATTYSTYRIYRAKISEGSSIVRDYVPAYDEVKNKPCMYDLINNVAYYNDGTGEFVMPPKREGSYTGFAQLGGIGNRLGCLIGDELPGGYVRLNYIESTGTQKIVFDYEGSIHTGMRGKYQQTEFPGEVTAYAGVTKEGTRITLTNVQPKTSYANPVFAWGLYAYYYNTPRFNSEYYGIIEASTNWMEDSTGSIWFDGKTSSNVQTTFSQDGTYSGITIATGKYKHYWYKISEGQNVVRNFVPCLDIYGVPCMYETITQQAFYNVGSGEYLYG